MLSLRSLASLAAASTLAALTLAGMPAAASAQEAAASVANAQAPAMRTRLMTSLSGWEVEQYLARNDVLFVPVGPVEQNGGMPTDVEYVIPLAYAMELAERGDGLVAP